MLISEALISRNISSSPTNQFYNSSQNTSNSFSNSPLNVNQSMLENAVSKACKEDILQTKNFVWEILAKDKMNVGSNEQILILSCGYSQSATYNVFHNSAEGLKLLEFDIFDYTKKTMVATSDVVFTPASNFPYPQKFLGLINGKNGFDCGQMLYYSWQNTTKKYNLDKSKYKDCQNANLGYLQDSNWTTIYPKIEY